MSEKQAGTEAAKEGKLKTFVLSDESVNSYGFRVITAGIDIEQFLKNPVMLWNHCRDFSGEGKLLPPGKWVNVRIENCQLLGDSDFDLLDPKGAELARKVDGGYINMCSVGLVVIETSDDPKHIMPGQKYATITKCKLREVSITDIGSNDNSLCLYDNEGKIINLSDGGKMPLPPLKTKKKMNKVNGILNLASDDASDEAVELAVQALAKERDELREQVKLMQEAEMKQKKESAERLVDAAIKSGKIAATAKDAYLALFDADFANAAKVIADMPERVKLSEMTAGGVGYADPTLSLSWDELDKAGKLAELKANHPEVYAYKFEEKFKK